MMATKRARNIDIIEPKFLLKAVEIIEEKVIGLSGAIKDLKTVLEHCQGPIMLRPPLPSSWAKMGGNACHRSGQGRSSR